MGDSREADIRKAFNSHKETSLKTLASYYDFAAGYDAALSRSVQEPVAWVADYRKSDGATDFYVMIGKGESAISLHMHKIRGRAEYEAAEINHVLNGSQKPEFSDFDLDAPQPTHGTSATDPAPSVISRGFDAYEMAARLIEDNVILHTAAGKVLRPRQEGNQDGLYYATAIRALVTNHGSKSDLHPEYVTSEDGTDHGYKSALHPGNGSRRK